MLIGIVDDDASILRALRRLLGTAGLAVATFASGEELLGPTTSTGSSVSSSTFTSAG